MSLKLRVFDFLHFEDIGGLWVLEVLLDLIFIIYLECLKLSSQLLFQLIR
jgi:hypothetical protein